MENISSVNYLQVIEPTREEKIKMYMKLTKKELAEMLANCNEVLDMLSRQSLKQPEQQEPCTSWANCKNPQMDCINCPLRTPHFEDPNQKYPCYFTSKDTDGTYEHGSRWTPYGIETWYSSEELCQNSLI